MHSAGRFVGMCLLASSVFSSVGLCLLTCTVCYSDSIPTQGYCLTSCQHLPPVMYVAHDATAHHAVNTSHAHHANHDHQTSFMHVLAFHGFREDSCFDCSSDTCNQAHTKQVSLANIFIFAPDREKSLNICIIRKAWEFFRKAHAKGSHAPPRLCPTFTRPHAEWCDRPQNFPMGVTESLGNVHFA